MIRKTEKSLIDNYTKDASNFRGEAGEVFIPETVEELSEATRMCFKNKTPATICGAGTGLTGSCVPLGGAVISLEKLNKIIMIDAGKKSALVQPGLLLSELQSTLKGMGLFYPPNPTEINSSIGGNAATNASGSKTFKYGPTRGFIESLKIVLADGDILHIKRGESIAKGRDLVLKTVSGRRIDIELPEAAMPQVKHAAGYYFHKNMDAVDLFIGSEGTLGIYAEIGLKLLDAPEKVTGGIIFFDDVKKLIDFIIDLRRISIGNNLIASDRIQSVSARLIEYFDSHSLDLLRPKYSQIPSGAKEAIWFEQEYSEKNEEAVLSEWLAMIEKYTGLADQTWIAMSSKEHENLRQFRHSLPLEINEILVRDKLVKMATDTAVPEVHFRELFVFIQDELARSGLRNLTFGHVGNCHLHANMFPASESEKKKAEEIYLRIINKSIAMGGTVSAEHGIGKIKRQYLEMLYGPEVIGQMKRIKSALDPGWLLGRGNLFQAS